MRTLLCSTAIVLAISAPAFAADCMSDLKTLNERLAQDNNPYRASLDAETKRDLRELRDAARLLHQNGQEEACVNVVESIETTLNSSQETTTAGQKDKDDETVYGEWHETEAKRLKTATPVTQFSQNFGADEVIGLDVRNMDNADLGEVTDIVIDPAQGNIAYAVISYGGILGLGDREIAVPWDRLQLTTERDVFVLQMTEEQLEEAPDLERTNKDTLRDPNWREKNDKFYQDLG
jgi:sporulation protein YlmC with PRC-barrel domain